MRLIELFGSKAVKLGIKATTKAEIIDQLVELQATHGNITMGLCFISEGAIPFAAADPARVLPACILGSAISGCLSMMFGCTLQAPHGGIFVFPTVGNPAMYVVALVVGSVVGALVLSLMKKDKR